MYQINKYSWFLVLVFVVACFAMEYPSPTMSWEALYLTTPLIIYFIFWSERTSSLLNNTTQLKTKGELFRLDLFLISYSFIFSELFSLIFQFNNTDARSWWPLGLALITAFGLLYALIYSLFAQLLANHRSYTFIFSFLTIVLIPTLSLLTYMMPFSVFASSEFFYGALCLLMGIHILLCLGYRVLLCFRQYR